MLPISNLFTVRARQDQVARNDGISCPCEGLLGIRYNVSDNLRKVEQYGGCEEG